MERVLRLGEGVRVGGWFLAEQRIVYAGEVSPAVFSVVAEWSVGSNSAAYNVYFRENQGAFRLLGGTVTVLSASQHEFRFRFER